MSFEKVQELKIKKLENSLTLLVGKKYFTIRTNIIILIRIRGLLWKQS
jgi:hypothetical protein